LRDRNRELAAVQRAFALAIEQERLSVAPRVKLLAENNARQGFVTVTQFEVVGKLPDYLRDMARFRYLTGWRRGEVVSLEWSDVERAGQRIILRRERSKSVSRTVPFVGEVAAIIGWRWEARDISRYVFHHNGRAIQDFRGAWGTWCKAAGIPALLFHDLRRSGVRNRVTAGVDQSVAMPITDDVRAALARTEAANRAAMDARSGQLTHEGDRRGTIGARRSAGPSVSLPEVRDFTLVREGGLEPPRG
jgi:integrase